MKKNAKFINSLKIEGYVYGTGSGFDQLSVRVTGENSKHPGTTYIAGNLEIATDEDCLNIITVHYSYVTPTYASGKVNKTYDVLKTIIDNAETKTIMTGGKDNAFKVKCSGISLGINDFIASDGSKVATLRNENGFCELVNVFTEDEDEKHKFTTDMLITKVTRIEADPEKNIDADYANVSGCVFGFGPKIIPATFVVKNEAGIKYFEDLEASPANPIFTKVWGRINCSITKIVKTEESAFGEAAVQTYDKKVREYVITGTAKVIYDFGDEEVLTAEDVKEMSQARQTVLAEVQKRFDEKSNAIATAPTAPSKKAAPKNNAILDGDFNF